MRVERGLILLAALWVLLQGGSVFAASVHLIGGGAKGWDGWTATGDAWRQTTNDRAGNPTPALAHVESTEQSTGTYRSPSFVIRGDAIEFLANGWDLRDGGQNQNKFLLRSAKDGSVLRQSAPPLQDPLVKLSWYVSDLKGQHVYFEAVDGISAPGFAWLGLASVVERTMDVPASASTYQAIRLSDTGTWAILTVTGGAYKGEPYLSSLGGTEAGRGEIESPAFTISVPAIRLNVRGWDGRYGEIGQNLFELCDASTGEVLRKSEPPLCDEPKWIEWDARDLQGRSVRIRLIDDNSDRTFAWMGIDEVDAGSDYHVRFTNSSILSSSKGAAAWKARVLEPVYCDIGGVPFLANSSSAAVENRTTKIPIGCAAKHVYLLGMTTSLDQGNDCWSSPSAYARRFFIGDNIGTIRVAYADGVVQSYPLVLGENVWWGRRFTQNPEPFASNPKAAKVLKQSLKLYPAGPSSDGRYVAAIIPRGARIDRIEVVGSKEKAGAPVIVGVTIDAAVGAKAANAVPLGHNNLTSGMAAFAANSHLRLSGTGDTTHNLSRLREVLYTTESNFPKHVPVTIPSGYRGPEFKFDGNAYAEVLTNILYANLDDISKRVDAEGMYHTSAKGASSWGGYEGFGSYRDGVGSYYTQSWTRDMGRSLGELCALGYLDEARRCADYTLAKARVWEEQADLRLPVSGFPQGSNPETQLVTLPRHICRVLQMPNTTPGQGCFENDGHGLTALFIYNLWRHLPDRDKWLRARWDDVQGLGDWVEWQFEHPEVSGAKETLRTDSECAGGIGYSVYADVACIEALDALADVADSIGKTDKAKQWRARAELMRSGCRADYLTMDKTYGQTWTLDHSGWPNRSTVMGPIILPSDRTGFLGLSTDPWKSYNEATYKRQVESYKPFGYFGVAMGYGQGFVTQSALLLDKMQDATTMLQWAAKETYNANFKPYIVPEGCEIDPTGRFWHRTGDLGNGVQQAEIVKALRIVVGIDDSSPKLLHICPRLPLGWTKIHVGRYPVLIERNGKIETAHVSYTLTRTGSNPSTSSGCCLRLTSDTPMPPIMIRLGPLGANGKVSGTLEKSGDSLWKVFKIPGGRTDLTVTTGR